MKDVVFSYMGRATFILCLVGLMIHALTGCGVSFNSTAEKALTGSSAPFISCSANPTSLISGNTAQISTKAISPVALPLIYSYDTTGGSLTSQGVSATLNTQGVSGNITVTCKVVDTKGNAASFTTTVVVQPNESAPPDVSCLANPSSVTLGGSVSITAVASSPQGRLLTYNWSASSGTISGTGTTAILDTNGATPGAITVTCRVADDQGRSASAATTVIVNAPVSAPPTMSCLPNPSTVTLGGTVVITATAKSPEGRPLTYTWGTSSGTISGSGNTATLNTRGAAAGAITVSCGVADDQGRSASTMTTVIANAPVSTPPSVSCSASPSIIDQGGSVAITSAGSSPKGLPLTYSYSTSAGSISGASATATLETSAVSAGVVTVTCTVDEQGGGGTASATTRILLRSVVGEQALTNFQFTDSVGINVHLSYGNTVYGLQFPQIMQSMIDLGVKHFRDGLNQYAPTFQYDNAEMLGKSGIKADWIMDINNSAGVINSAYTNAPDATAEFEGPNEDDAQTGLPLLTFMQLLHDTVRGNPATAAMPIIAPSFKQSSSFATQGNLSSLIDFGNTHDYFQQRNPETAPYGGPFYNCGGYGSMQFNICLSQMVGVRKQVISTETGYESGVGLSDAIIGRYELRTLFESLRLGIIRTFLYELADDPSGNWGLLTGSLSPKPAYTAIRNVLSLLKDVSFGQAGKLDYTLAGQTQNVHHVLLQKSDGTFYLAIWLAVQSADPDNPSTIYDVAHQDVTLSANTPIGEATSYALDDGGNMTSTSAELTNGSLSIAVTDRVTLVALSPGQSH